MATVLVHTPYKCIRSLSLCPCWCRGALPPHKFCDATVPSHSKTGLLLLLVAHERFAVPFDLLSCLGVANTTQLRKFLGIGQRLVELTLN